MGILPVHVIRRIDADSPGMHAFGLGRHARLDGKVCAILDGDIAAGCRNADGLAPHAAAIRRVAVVGRRHVHGGSRNGDVAARFAVARGRDHVGAGGGIQLAGALDG